MLTEKRDERPVAPLDRRLDHVHRRRADEASDEQVDRPLVELLGRRHLLQLALAHHGDAVAHRHRLDLVVRHVDGRHAEVVLQARDLGAHVHAQLRVEVRERLVHQVGLRLAHDRSAHRHALALPSGKRSRLALEELLEPEDAGGVAHPPVDLVLRLLPQPEAERDVVVDAQVRIEGVALEDHGDVAVARGHVVDDPLADADDALADRLETGDHPKRSRLAAPGGPDEHHELAVVDLEIEAVDRARPVGIHLRHVLERDLRHRARLPVAHDRQTGAATRACGSPGRRRSCRPRQAPCRAGSP